MSEMVDAAARRAQENATAAIEEHAWLGAAIDADAAEGRFAAWGASSVIDENTGAAVIEPDLFAALHERAGLAPRWPVGNAGLLHVYGYLLSTAPTPYGLKRDRWLDGALAHAYGLARDEFVPWARARTLLDRVSERASALLTDASARASMVGPVPTSVAVARVPDDGPWALAYAVGGLLVTTFPVDSAAAALRQWDEEPARLRWNAAG